MQTDGITVEIAAASIYEHSIVTVRFTAVSAFRVFISGEVIAVRRGSRSGEQFQSQEKDGVHGIELELIGLFRETRIRSSEPMADAHGETAHKQYGMRFYPLTVESIHRNGPC